MQCQSQTVRGKKNAQSSVNTFFPHCPLKTGGSLLAGQIGCHHRLVLLCSSWHRFNKEKFVQNLFISKSRVWQQQAKVGGSATHTHTHTHNAPNHPHAHPLFWCEMLSFYLFFSASHIKDTQGPRHSSSIFKRTLSFFVCVLWDFSLCNWILKLKTEFRYKICDCVFFLSHKVYELSHCYYSSSASMSRPFFTPLQSS